MRLTARAVALVVGSLPFTLGACALVGRGTLSRRPGSDIVLPVAPLPRLMLKDGQLACAKVPLGPIVVVAGKTPQCTYAGMDSIRLPIPPVVLPRP